MITTLIINHEHNCRIQLRSVLEYYFTGKLNIITANGPKEGLEKIISLKPELVVADIEMTSANALNMFQQFKGKNFKVIFTAGSEAHAVRALRMGAFDYLLQPVNPMELKDAVTRFIQENKTREQSNDMGNGAGHNLTINTKEGVVFLEKEKIIRCEATINYTNFILTENKRFLSSKTLKEYVEVLSEQDNFIQVHRSHLINVDYIEKLNRRGYITMKDSTIIPISRRMKDKVFCKLSL